MKLSDQAIGVLMMALQKSLLEQKDMVPMLKELNWDLMDNNQLMVKNPPDITVGVPVSPNVKTVEKDHTFLYDS